MDSPGPPLTSSFPGVHNYRLEVHATTRVVIHRFKTDIRLYELEVRLRLAMVRNATFHAFMTFNEIASQQSDESVKEHTLWQSFPRHCHRGKPR